MLALVLWGLVGSRPATVNVSAAVGGETITMTVKGAKTSTFHGDDFGRTTGVINVSSYPYQLNVPYAAANGLQSAARQHSAVTVTHLLGANSPQFLNAESTGELLTSVVFTFNRINTVGQSVVFYKVTLTNAHLVNDTQSLSGAVVVEELTFTFQKIQQVQSPTNITYADYWSLS